MSDRERIAKLEQALAEAHPDRAHWQRLACSRSKSLVVQAAEIERWKARAELAEAKVRLGAKVHLGAR